MERNRTEQPHYDALVTDAADRGPLAGLRGLGRAGLATVAVAPRGAAGLHSRYADARIVAPDPATDAVQFAEGLAAAVAELRPRVLYPGWEEAIDAILSSPEAATLAPLLPYPRLEALALLRDKRRLPELAAEHGLDAPQTLAEGTAAEVAVAVGGRPCASSQRCPAAPSTARTSFAPRPSCALSSPGCRRGSESWRRSCAGASCSAWPWSSTPTAG